MARPNTTTISTGMPTDDTQRLAHEDLDFAAAMWQPICHAAVRPEADNPRPSTVGYRSPAPIMQVACRQPDGRVKSV
jgi:hypothetical protein